MRKWPELREGTAVGRVKEMTRLLDAQIVTVRARYKDAPDFVKHAIIEAFREQMSRELYNIHPPKNWMDDYSEWTKDEAIIWLSETLWENAVASGFPGVK